MADELGGKVIIYFPTLRLKHMAFNNDDIKNEKYIQERAIKRKLKFECYKHLLVAN